ncbi:MAG: hypothetical protein IIW86_05725 [Clostridia bacterium]|nr:hypothetical protein [Clostridia bacterium]
MTIIERVKECVKNLECEKDSIEKVIALAYYIGKEEATREVSDAYTNLIREQRKRADKCHYKHMAHEVIGSQNYIYFGDYDMAMTGIFGSDPTEN